MNRIFSLCLFAVLLCLAGKLGAEIRPNEALQIAISGVPDADRSNISAVYPVSEEGMINLPYIGLVKASGSGAMELAKRIEAAYRKAEVFVEPAVNVTVIGDGRLMAKKVVVGGFVKRPGDVEFREGLTLWQAIQGAGGENEFGAVRRVELHRAGGMKAYDLRKNEARGVRLLENDSINMPQKRPFEGGW